MRAHFSRSTLLVAAVAAVIAGCGGGGGSHNSGSSATITAQPSSATVAIGSTATFSVTAKGSDLTYQWYKNGAAVTGATSATYSFTVTASDADTAYYVVVTGSSGSTAKSSTVTLTVGASGSPSIITQPSAASAPIGGTASFTIVASGDNLTYQWYKDSAAISGATSATYTIATVASSSVGTYYVIVTNASGSVTSSKVALTLGTASKPTITSQPTSQTKAVGATAVFSVAASGSAPLSYQWYKDDAAISGATSSSYSVATNSSSGGSYKVTVSNSLGSVTSESATLTVVSTPVITTQPTPQTAFVGQSVTFTVAASGANLSYQWYKDGNSVSGATNATLTISPVTAASAGSYKAIVSNLAGNASSNTATLTVYTAPTIVTQPASTTVGVGSAATFTVAATGNGSLTYQWYKNNTAVSGATGTSYTTDATTTSDNGAKYYVVVTNTAGSTTSTTATLTVDQAPVITSQPSSVTVTHPNTATFSVTATASGTLTYQWYSTTSGLISGATSSTYTTPATTVAMSGTQYYVKVFNDGVIATTSSNATLTVN